MKITQINVDKVVYYREIKPSQWFRIGSILYYRRPRGVVYSITDQGIEQVWSMESDQVVTPVKIEEIRYSIE